MGADFQGGVIVATGTVTAKEILDLLAVRHADAVFVPECKNGPSQGSNHNRMDAWVMNKSWSAPLTIGYEIKVNRQDFLRDQKWHSYLPLCNEFYFVTPKDVIEPSELPQEAGLLLASENLKRLYIKKKAPRRPGDINVDVFRYVLMCRARITRKEIQPDDPNDKLEYWKRWLEKSKESRDIGYMVSQRMSDLWREMERRCDELERENKALGVFRDRLAELGVNHHQRIDTWTVPNALRKLQGEIPFYVKQSIKDAYRHLETLQKLVDAVPDVDSE